MVAVTDSVFARISGSEKGIKGLGFRGLVRHLGSPSW